MAILTITSTALLVLHLCIFNYAASQRNSNFTVEPSNQTTFVGASAKFVCSHPEADLLSWFLNGNLVLQSAPGTMNSTDACFNEANFSINTDPVYANMTIRQAVRSCNKSFIQCIAFRYIMRMLEPIERSREVILIIREPPPVKENSMNLSGSNGTITITWTEPDLRLKDKANLTYHLYITPLENPSGDSAQNVPISLNGSNLNFLHCNASSVNGSSFMYLYCPYNPTACTRLDVSITVLINGHEGLLRAHMIGTLFEVPDSIIDGSMVITSVTFDGMKLIYEVMLPSGIPVCNMSITATNTLSREKFKISVKVNTQPTTMFITFSVDNEELPFDEYYNVRVKIYNPLNSSSQLKWPTRLSTHDIQEYTLDKNNEFLTLEFVRNSSALGALLVFGNIDSRDFDYVPIMNSKMNSVTRYNISGPNNRLSCQSSNCTLLIYTLGADGVPKHNNTAMEPASPIYADKYSYTMGEKAPKTGVNSEEDMQVSVTADVTTTNDLITFTCMIQDDSDTQGCIVILHNTLNISALRVNTVDKNFKSSFSRIPLPEGEDYLYAVFPWSNLTGLLEFEVVTKGIAPQIEDKNDWKKAVTSSVVVVVIMLIIVIIGLSVKFLTVWNKDRQWKVGSSPDDQKKKK